MPKNYFSLYEFTRKGFPEKPTPLEQYLLNGITHTLNIIREDIASPITISDCYRSVDKYHSMVARGYNPSPTSDHFWGQAIPTMRSKDIDKYGTYYTYSVGAVDFVVSKLDMEIVFKKIINLSKKGEIEIGQCILETNPKRNVKWIHISNSKDYVLNKDLISKLNIAKYKFLRSDDNGKTYQIVEV